MMGGGRREEGISWEVESKEAATEGEDKAEMIESSSAREGGHSRDSLEDRKQLRLCFQLRHADESASWPAMRLKCPLFSDFALARFLSVRTANSLVCSR